MLFRYVGWNENGERVRGEVDAPTRAIALSRLQKKGVLVDQVSQSFAIGKLVSGRQGKLGLRQVSLLCSQMAMMLEGGIPLLQTLQVMSAQTKPPLKKVIAELAATVEGGQPLSTALAGRRDIFPHLMIHVVAVSEVSGELARGLEMLGNQFEREDEIQRKVKSAMVYPKVVLTMAGALLFFMVGFMIPKYGDMFGQLGAELPTSTRLMMSMGNFVQANWWMPLALVVGVMTGFRFAVNRFERFRLLVHRLALKVPVFGPLGLKRSLARYTQALATTLKSGVPVLQATESAAEVVDNDVLARAMAGVPGQMQQGETLTKALRQTGVFPPIMVELLGIGEMIGNTDTTLSRVSGFLEDEVNDTVDRLTSILEPFLIVLLGGIVLVTVVPMVLPMFSIYGKIS